MIKALVFDFDGLIIDTETPSYYAFQQLYKKYGVELPAATYAQCVGTSLEHFNPYTYIAECLDEVIDLAIFKAEFKTIYAELLKEADIRPGVIDYLEAAKQMNLKIGLASSSTISWIEPYLQKHGLAGFFDSICTAELVERVKPDPELYLQSLKNLGVTGEEAISFEDSLNGFKAAQAAGLHCVIVPNELTKDFEFHGYDLLISSMKELSLKKLIGKLLMNREPAQHRFEIISMSEDVYLTEPSIELRDEYLSFYEEWVDSRENMVPWVISKNPSRFEEMLQFLHDNKHSLNLPEGWVNDSTYWLVTESKRVIGAVNIRHALTEKLFNCGGHIGYCIRPSERRKGYATILLRLALEKAQLLGVNRVLVVCDKQNIASKKTIVKNGGIHDSDYVEEDGNVIQRFWIG